MPKGTDAPDGAEAVDTAFQTCTDTDCELPDFENVELQRLTLNFPAGAGLSGERQASTQHPVETEAKPKHCCFSYILSGAVHFQGDRRSEHLDHDAWYLEKGHAHMHVSRQCSYDGHEPRQARFAPRDIVSTACVQA